MCKVKLCIEGSSVECLMLFLSYVLFGYGITPVCGVLGKLSYDNNLALSINLVKLHPRRY